MAHIRHTCYISGSVMLCLFLLGTRYDDLIHHQLIKYNFRIYHGLRHRLESKTDCNIHGDAQANEMSNTAREVARAYTYT